MCVASERVFPALYRTEKAQRDRVDVFFLRHNERKRGDDLMWRYCLLFTVWIPFAGLSASNAAEPDDNAVTATETVTPSDMPQLEEVEVVVDTAEVKVGQEVIASINKGDRFTVIRRQGPWVAIAVEGRGKKRLGWVMATKLQTVVSEDMDEGVAAPETPELLSVDVKFTQMPRSISYSQRCLYLQLTITNGDINPIAYDVGDFSLKIDGNPVSHEPARHSSYSSYDQVQTGGAGRPVRKPGELDYLESGTIPPGGTATGWLRFKLPQVRNIEDLTPKAWALFGKAGTRTVAIDLHETESQTLAVKARPSIIDPSVRVIEVGSRVNVLNVGELREVVKSVAGASKESVIVAKTADTLVDATVVSERLAGRVSGTAHVPVLWVSPPVGRRAPPSGIILPTGIQSSGLSEGAAVMRVLGQRQGTGPKLASFLNSEAPKTRAAAATALAEHLSESGVVDALIKAAGDEDPNTRVSTVNSLTQAKTAAATQAIVASFGDANPAVRSTAAKAAASHPANMVVEPLIALLADDVSTVVSYAAASLGRLKAQEAIKPLEALRKRDDGRYEARAVDALRSIGALSDVEAALAKIGKTALQANELKALADAKEKRAVAKIIETLPRSGSRPGGVSPDPFGAPAAYGRQSGTNELIWLLGEIGDPAAVEPLVALVETGRITHSEIPGALAKLGDKRAIGPLQDILKRTSRGSSQRFAIFESLLKLGAPGVAKQAAEEIKTGDIRVAGQLIGALGRSGNNEAVDVIAPFLDHPQQHNYAALALLQIGTPEALEVIKNRLTSPDSRYAFNVVGQLGSPTIQNPIFFLPPPTSRLRRLHSPQSMYAQFESQLPMRIALLNELAKSEVPALRDSAAKTRDLLEGRLIAKRLKPLEAAVKAKDFDGVAKALNDIVDEALAAETDDPQPQKTLARSLAVVQAAYAGAGQTAQFRRQFAENPGVRNVLLGLLGRDNLDGASRIAALGAARVLDALESHGPEVRQQLLVYRAFVALDRDWDGALSEEEFAQTQRLPGNLSDTVATFPMSKTQFTERWQQATRNAESVGARRPTRTAIPGRRPSRLHTNTDLYGRPSVHGRTLGQRTWQRRRRLAGGRIRTQHRRWSSPYRNARRHGVSTDRP